MSGTLGNSGVGQILSFLWGVDSEPQTCFEIEFLMLIKYQEIFSKIMRNFIKQFSDIFKMEIKFGYVGLSEALVE